MRGFVGLAGPYDFLPLDGPITTATFGGWPRPEETQPIHFAGLGDPPSLLLAGAEDETVLPRNSVALGERLRAAGVAAEVRIYPRLGHVGMVTALARPFRGRAPVLADMAAFAHRVTADSGAADAAPITFVGAGWRFVGGYVAGGAHPADHRSADERTAAFP